MYVRAQGRTHTHALLSAAVVYLYGCVCSLTPHSDACMHADTTCHHTCHHTCHVSAHTQSGATNYNTVFTLGYRTCLLRTTHCE